jgi:hypothetical protein
MRVSVPTACSPNVPAPVRSLPLRQYTHTLPADVPCALRVLPEELDVLWRRDGPSSSGQPPRTPRPPPSSGHPRDRRARSSAPRPFRNVDAPLAAVWPPPSPPCPVYHSLSIVPVGTLTSPGGHGPPANGLPADRSLALGSGQIMCSLQDVAARLTRRCVWHSMPLTRAGSLDPRGGHSCALWQGLLGRPASESGG